MTAASDKLKACPFCGSESVALVGSFVRCGNCGASGPFGCTAEDAIEFLLAGATAIQVCAELMSRLRPSLLADKGYKFLQVRTA